MKVRAITLISCLEFGSEFLLVKNLHVPSNRSEKQWLCAWDLTIMWRKKNIWPHQ